MFKVLNVEEDQKQSSPSKTTGTSEDDNDNNNEEDGEEQQNNDDNANNAVVDMPNGYIFPGFLPFVLWGPVLPHGLDEMYQARVYWIDDTSLSSSLKERKMEE